MAIGSRIAAIAALVVTVAACGGSSPPAAQTDVGITSTEILLGTTNALTGPAAAYGTISSAETAYFTYINNQGGINGRKITFKVFDDGYDPNKTVPLTKQLVEQDKVFATFGALGTQTQVSVRDYMNAQKVPQLFVSTGATTFGLDYSQHPWTMGWQPPYQGEAKIYAADVVKNHANAKIGVLYQNDDYGQDYLKGLEDGLGSNKSMIVDKQSYDVTATSVASQVSTLKAKGVDTLFVFTTPGFTIRALATITKLNWEPTIYLNSVSASLLWINLAKKSGAALKNITSVSYLKDATDPQMANDAGIKLYKDVIALCSTCKFEDGFNLFGVAQAYTMVDILKQAGSNLSRANVRDIAASRLNETNPFVLPGVQVKTTATDHFPIAQTQVITWNGTGWTLVGSVISERGTIK